MAARAGCGGAAARLDTSVDNCSLPPEVHKVYSRSAWDRLGGGASRFRTHQRVFLGTLSTLEQKGPEGMVPYFVTLTVDRRRFLADHPEEVEASRSAFRVLGSKLRNVMRRVRCVEWIKALEWQSATGCGWAHWHLVAWFSRDTPISEVRRSIQGRWSGVGGGFVRVDRARRKDGRWESLAGYISKYVTKASDVVPPVLDHSSFVMAPRAYSMSKAMGKRVREMVPARPKFYRLKRARRSRVLLPFAQRLDASGASVRVWEYKVDTETGVVRPKPSKALPISSKGLELAEREGVIVGWSPAIMGKRDGFKPIVRDVASLVRFAEANAGRLIEWQSEEIAVNRLQRLHAWHEHQRSRVRVAAVPAEATTESGRACALGGVGAKGPPGSEQPPPREAVEADAQRRADAK